jgi:integrase
MTENKPIKEQFSDNKVAKWKASGTGEYVDTVVPWLRAIITRKGVKFIYYGPLEKGKPSSRYRLGEWSENFTVLDARTKARKWRADVDQGINPKEEIKKAKAAARKQTQETLDAAIDEWAKFKVQKERCCPQSTQRRVLDIRRMAPKEWLQGSILELSNSRKAILAHLDELANNSIPLANRLHVSLGSIFTWAIEREKFDIEINPAKQIRAGAYGYSRAKALSGRPFTDEEVRALWRAATLSTYPWGVWFKFLLLTASRNGEATIARWSEIDFDKKMWTIPAAHAKGGKRSGVDIRKPLSDAAIDLLKQLPRDLQTVAGMGVHGNVLRFYDPAMIFGLREMEIAYNSQGCRKSPKQVISKHLPEGFPKWKFHWTRKTYRTRMSPHISAVGETAIELFMGHHPKDAVQAAYDYHEYEDQMRKAANIWAEIVERIVNPQPNVLQFPKNTA